MPAVFRDTAVPEYYTRIGGVRTKALFTASDLSDTYVNVDGTVALTADWDAGAFDIRAATLTPDGITLGSVMFAGTNGVISQDNSDLFWDDTDKRLGIGTAIPLTPLHVFRNSGAAGSLRFENTSGAVNINLVANAGAISEIQFSDPPGPNIGRIRYSHITNTLGFKVNGGGTDKVIFDSVGNIIIGSTAFPSTGTQGLVMGDGTALSTMGSNTAGLYANDVSGTVKMHVIHEDDTAGPIVGSFGTPANNQLAVWTGVDLIEGDSKITWDGSALTTDGFAGGITTKTGTYTVTVADHVILCDASGGIFTVTLFAAANALGIILHIKKIDSSGNIITIDADGTETIDGGLTASLAVQYESFMLVSDGSNWHVI